MNENTEVSACKNQIDQAPPTTPPQNTANFPPDGWEGGWNMNVATVEEFMKWIDNEVFVQEVLMNGVTVVAPRSYDMPRDGRVVRNAYRLVLRLNQNGLLLGMPPRPKGPFLLDDELRVLQDLKLKCLELYPPQATLPVGTPVGDNEADTTKGQDSAGQPVDKKPKGKGKNINARMLETLGKNNESYGWSAQQWADALGCVRGTIGETYTWTVTLNRIKARLKVDAELKEDRKKRRSDGD